MDKERGKGKYDGFTYYKSHIFNNNDSSYNKFNSNIFTELTKTLSNNDNSEYYVLDLQGGYGKWGNLVAKNIKAKKCIVTDYSEKMIEFGKTIYDEDEVEYYNLDFNSSLTDENIIKNKYCAIIIKEAIHFSEKGYSEKLIKFFKDYCTKEAIIICCGVIRTRNWKVLPEELPKTCIANLDNLVYDDIDFLNEVKLNEEVKVEYEILPVPYHMPIEEYITFLKNRSWSSFRTVPEEEIDNCLNKQIDEKKEWVKFEVYFAYIHITNK